LCYNKLISY